MLRRLPPTPLLTLALAGALALAACADVGDAPVAETTAVTDADAAGAAFTGTRLPLDTAATRIEWTGAKVTRAHEGGFRRFDGALYLEGETLTGAEVTIDVASLYTDSERLEGHLRSDDFFDVGTYPEARIRITAAEPLAAADTVGRADGTHRVTGLLTMRGQTNQVAFPARIEVTPEAVTAEADFIIDRQQWGITYPGQPDDLIRDEVRIRLHAVAPRPAGDGGAATSAVP